MVDILRIIVNALWLVAPLCMYLLTTNAFLNAYAQEGKKIFNGELSSPEIHSVILPTLPSKAEPLSKSVPPSNNSTGDASGTANSTLFLKYNNLGNSNNKAKLVPNSFPGITDPASAYNLQHVPPSSANPYYYPSYNYYPYMSGTSPYPQLAPPPTYNPYSQVSTPLLPSLPPFSPTSPSALPYSSGFFAQPYSLPPPPVFPLPRYLPESVQDSSLGSEDSLVEEDSKMVSPWFPSIPASDCEGIFEFTLEGTANLQAKNLKSGNHKFTIKMASDNTDSISGQLWIDKKTNNEKGTKFNVDKTFNNCRIVTALSGSSISSPNEQGESSSALLNSLLNDLSDDDQHTEEETEDTDNSGSNLQQENIEDGESAEGNGKKIASLE
jgi:hypothetical protein